MRVLTSTLRRPEPVRWPRYVDGQLRYIPIAREQIPAGWQNVTVRVPMRLATCEETDCPMFLAGWSEVHTPDGNSHPEGGQVSADEAAQTWGALASTTIHPPGTPCGRIHKVPSGLPPIYSVDGRTVLWNEFEDSLAGGVEATRRLVG